jgi:putative resolvase
VCADATQAAGASERRTKLCRLLADSAVTVVAVTHRDRLACVNAELIQAALTAQNQRQLMMDDEEVTVGLMDDLVVVLTTFCARLYGRQSTRNRALQALRCAQSKLGVSGR